MSQTSVDGLAVLLLSLPGYQTRDGHIVITRKLHEGLVGNLEYWKGRMRVLLEPAEVPSNNLDNLSVDPARLPYELKLLPFTSPSLADELRGAAVVGGTVGWQQRYLARTCLELGVPFLYGTEYSLRTRRQIIDAEHKNPIIRARKYVFEVNQERRNRLAVQLATGVQCNGTPTFDAYSALNPRALLFFDNRTPSNLLIRQEELERRLATLDAKRPLHLAFSGRLDAMKGARYLPQIARELRERNVDFVFSICGGGSLANEVARDIEQLGLTDRVHMKGVLPYAEALVPFMKEQVDLFVCPHVQGDPSCTYVETFGCGVPIVGFANEAFEGILKRVNVGWSVPMGDVAGIAQVIQRLEEDRQPLKAFARAARGFAAQHTFEATWQARIEHMRACASVRPPRPALGSFARALVTSVAPVLPRRH
jgi:glycosyltransferase involved in cell wall biosynthesis